MILIFAERFTQTYVALRLPGTALRKNEKKEKKTALGKGGGLRILVSFLLDTIIPNAEDFK